MVMRTILVDCGWIKIERQNLNKFFIYMGTREEVSCVIRTCFQTFLCDQVLRFGHYLNTYAHSYFHLCGRFTTYAHTYFTFLDGSLVEDWVYRSSDILLKGQDSLENLIILDDIFGVILEQLKYFSGSIWPLSYEITQKSYNGYLQLIDNFNIHLVVEIKFHLCVV